jgi:hypothetical protein
MERVAIMETNKPYLKLKNKTLVVDATIVSKCEHLKDTYDVIITVVPGYSGAEYAVFYSNKDQMGEPKEMKLDKILGIIYAEKQSCNFLARRVVLVVKDTPGDTMDTIVMFARVIGLDVLIV